MKDLNISKKFTLINLIVTLLVLMMGYFVLNKYKNDLVDEVHNDVIANLKSLSEQRIKAKLEVGISNAISIANDSSIKESLANNDRELAIKTLANLSTSMKESTPFQNIQIHLHTKDNRSFFRSWQPDKFGDDLSPFRPSVVKVNAEKKAVTGFEIGTTIGLGIRSVVPIFDSNKNHIGSLEFMQGLKKLIDEQPDLLDKKVVYSCDDEGNIFSEVFYHATKGHFEDGEFRDTKKDVNAVCIN